MPMNLQKILEKQFEPVTETLSPRDCMLYALGIGMSSLPDDTDDLPYTFERGLKVFPSQINVLATAGGWVREPALEIDWVHLLHGEQKFELLAPLVAGRKYVGTTRVRDVLDKGRDKGVMLYVEKQVQDDESGGLVGIVTTTLVLRRDGGSGGTISSAPPIHPIPDWPPDLRVTLETLPQSGLIYRLSGDYNPIHADPEVARKAGFDRPILHGLCTLGVVTRALVRGCCNGKAENLRVVEGRFSAVVYPGESITTEMWRDGQNVSFRANVAGRGIVLNNGRAVLA